MESQRVEVNIPKRFGDSVPASGESLQAEVAEPGVDTYGGDERGRRVDVPDAALSASSEDSPTASTVRDYQSPGQQGMDLEVFRRKFTGHAWHQLQKDIGSINGKHPLVGSVPTKHERPV